MPTDPQKPGKKQTTMRVRPNVQDYAVEAVREEGAAAKTKAAVDGPDAKAQAAVSIGGISVVFEVVARHLETPPWVTMQVMARKIDPTTGKLPEDWNKSPETWDPGLAVSFTKGDGGTIASTAVSRVAHGKRGGICTLDSKDTPIRALDLLDQDLQFVSSRRQVIEKHTEETDGRPPGAKHRARHYPTERQFVRYSIHRTAGSYVAAWKRALTDRAGQPMLQALFRAQRVDVLLFPSGDVQAIAVDGQEIWTA
jgi:hypothetical protein